MAVKVLNCYGQSFVFKLLKAIFNKTILPTSTENCFLQVQATNLGSPNIPIFKALFLPFWQESRRKSKADSKSKPLCLYFSGITSFLKLKSRNKRQIQSEAIFFKECHFLGTISKKSNADSKCRPFFFREDFYFWTKIVKPKTDSK